ncbi:helix-turn-helix domain-containing protein [Pasteurella atlantica]|uniref:Helix-turn-helix domain-containing protein n=2 Tax=Pasteurellaceae TaxID=712 RepID=A0ACC6HJK7_9PAST|nr:helix-turn-helix domain-containing protein [Pasteurella atlantica]MDP8051037.1 helix-turn-helix domain-containing protein [Pasteurella atlantica]MDP8104333.1 helix-turn-helix domain-containing protein [Pasteurella atlantica]MDP8147693.1 helix-turn-helix domain-containing protein [Pasteurella atlantica]
MTKVNNEIISETNEGIQRAINICGSQTKLADLLGLTKAQVWQWLNCFVKVSAERCIEIEKLTKGQVRCEELRPDIDWSVLRNSK